jgi:uncharacterized membrane protein YdjX (TVP38/TMEM64 family)
MRKYGKPLLFLLIIALLLVLSRLFGWSDMINRDSLSLLQKVVADNLAAAALLYVALTVVGCVLLALPGVTFAVIAGVLFGPWLGTALCLLATTLGAIAAFLASRYFLRDWLKPMVMKNAPLRRILFDNAEHSAVNLLLITRLIPIFPYNLQNFAYGVTDIPFATYSLGSLIFMLPGTAMYTIGFAGIADREHRWLYIGIALALAVIVFGTAAWLRRKYITEEPSEIRTQEEDRQK